MAKIKTQLFLVHGGMTFNDKKEYLNFLKTRPVNIERKISWSDEYLRKKLDKKVHIIQPRMPCKDNSVYDEWKIHFERFFPYLTDNIILIGNSLGGIFLAKYLSENKFPKKILSVYLTCPPFDNTLPGESLSAGFILKNNLSLIEQNTNNLSLMFSKDDDVVPVSHAEKYKNKLPNANIVIYESKNGHFNISEFPEIIKMIKKDLKKVK